MHCPPLVMKSGPVTPSPADADQLRPVWGNQERYLLAEATSRRCFSIPVAYAIKGPLDVSRLHEAIRSASARHVASRMSFERRETGFWQRIHSAPEIDFIHLHVDSLDPPAVAARALPLVQQKPNIDSLRTFHRHVLLERAPDDFVLVLTQHRAVSDGVSMELFASEVFAFYDGRDLPTAGDPYDAVAALRDRMADAEACSAFWQSQLGEAETVPTLRPDLEGPSSTATERLQMPDTLSDRLRELADDEGVSAFNLLSAPFALQAARLEGADEAIFSIQSAGRYGMDPSIPVIGPFSNAVVLRARVDQDSSFVALARSLRDTINLALTHEAMPCHEVEQLTGIVPRLALDFYPAAQKPHARELEIGERLFLASDSDYALNLRWSETSSGGLQATAFFDPGTISASRVKAFIERSIELLRRLCDAPAAPLRSVRLTNPSLSTEPATDPISPPWKPTTTRIHARFLEVARSQPERVALRYDGSAISYGALCERADAIRKELRAAGAKPGDRIGLLIARSADLPAAMIAVSWFGASFAVLDPAYPGARLAAQVGLLQPKILLIGPDQPVPDWVTQADLPGLVVHTLRPADTSSVSPDSTDELPESAIPELEEAAYFLFTTGTTGTPKCVAVPHGPLQHFVSWQETHFELGENDRFTLLSGLSHDPVMRDVFTPLSIGASLSIPSQRTIYSPRDLVAWLQAEVPTVCHLTPPLGELIVTGFEGKAPALSRMRWMFWGGDRLKRSLPAQFSDHQPGLRHVNFYGATETPQAVSYFELIAASHQLAVPIGHAVPGISVRVISRDGMECDPEEAGEICVTAPFFVKQVREDGTLVPVADGPGGGYRTGDFGYRLPNGEILLVGRGDDQLKIRGFRVELDAVNLKLCEADPGVRLAVSRAVGEGTLRRLVSYVEPFSGQRPRPNDIRTAMRRLVPDYMIPHQVVVLDSLPLLPNGKIDRNALPDPDQIVSEHNIEADDTPVEAPSSPLEHKIVEAFELATGLPVNNVRLSLTDIGADSLSTIRAQLALEAEVEQLPEEWYDLSIKELATLGARSTSGGWLARQFRSVQIEPYAPIRGLCIVAVVALHFQWFSVGGSLTQILFLISGYSFGKFQLRNILDRDDPSSLARTLQTVLIATIPVTTLVYLVQVLRGQPAHLSTLLFYADFLNFGPSAPNDGRIVWLWFIGCYIQMWAVIYLALRLPAIRETLRTAPYRSFLILFVVGVMFRLVLPALVNPSIRLHGIPSGDFWNYLPTTNFATVAIGVIVALATTRRRRVLAAALCVAFAYASGAMFPPEVPLQFAIVALVLIFVPRVRVPYFLAPPLLALSGASLYIYLMHGPLHAVMSGFGLHPLPAVATIVVIVISTLLWSVWSNLINAMRSGNLSLALSSFVRKDPPAAEQGEI